MITLVFGDSISWGAYDYENGGWVELLKREGFNNEDFVYNLSVSGNTSDDIYHRLFEELVIRWDKEDDLRIIFAFGANDAGMINKKNVVSMGKFERNIIAIIDQSQIYTPNIYFVGLTPVENDKTCPVSWDENLYYRYSQIWNYNDKLRQIVEQDGRSKFIDVFDLLNYFDLVDGSHPNSLGHRKIFQKVLSELKK